MLQLAAVILGGILQVAADPLLCAADKPNSRTVWPVVAVGRAEARVCAPVCALADPLGEAAGDLHEFVGDDLVHLVRGARLDL